MAYGNHLRHLNKRIEVLLQSIAAMYNFDFGDEFEIILCEFLATLLPGRFGVCRGFIVASDSKIAGDDIIIYDRHSFPTLRLLPKGRYERKEEIPADAVYAYIEAKHTLYLSEPEAVGGSLAKAIKQIGAVKALKRTVVSPQGPFTRVLDYNGVLLPEPDPFCPDRSNPWYTCIIARQLRLRKGDQEAPSRILLADAIKALGPNAVPDLLIAGAILGIPVIESDGKLVVRSPFFVPTVSAIGCVAPDDGALPVGFCALLHALEWIQLSSMNWGGVIGDALRNAEISIAQF